MRYTGMLFVFTLMLVMAADSARGITGPVPVMLAGIVVAKAGEYCPPPPPPPPRSKSCPCDSQGNPIDNCGKGNDSQNP